MPLSDNIKIVMVNYQGLATPSKRQDVLNKYKQKRYSIICMHDINFITESESLIESEWGYKCIFNSFSSNLRDVCILFNNNFEFKIHRERKDCKGKY